jgi:hypothetical protein
MAHNVESDPNDDAPFLAFHAQHNAKPECPFEAVDATTYLLQSEANCNRLLAAIESINAGRNLVEISDFPNHVNA